MSLTLEEAKQLAKESLLKFVGQVEFPPNVKCEIVDGEPRLTIALGNDGREGSVIYYPLPAAECLAQLASEPGLEHLMFLPGEDLISTQRANIEHLVWYLLYAEHTKKWILNSVAHRACRHSIDTRTSPES
jgi:hypothetical protein